MNKHLLRRIFAIIALVGILGVTVFGTLTFFNLFAETYSVLFGTLATIFACVTAVFFILQYILRDKETTLGIPEEDLSATDGEADNAEKDVDGDGNVEEN